MILKLDIKKAFDTISWDFIVNILIARGFHPNFIQLIQRWLQNNHYSVLVNDNSYGFFSANRGIKQGDPLSPTIFILAFDYFSRLINNLQQNKSYTQFHHGSKILVSHLAYADDAIVFSNAGKNTIKLLMKTLDEFQQTSGLTFNKEKCNLYFSKYVSMPNANWTSSFTGCPSASLPLKYFGVNLLKGRRRQTQFDDAIEKINSRIGD